MKKTRVAIITAGDAEDRKVWSGIPHFIYRGLQQDFDEVVLLGPYQPDSLALRIANSFFYRSSTFLTSLSRRLFNSRYNHEDSLTMGKLYALYFEKKLAELGPFDLIIAPAALTTVCLLKTGTPIFTVGDATFLLLNGYYPYISNLAGLSQKETIATESLALRKAAVNIYSSQWAADSAVEDYGIDPKHVAVVPFGANIENDPPREMVVKEGFSYTLLFLSVDWARKGGPIAFDALVELVGRGLDVQLVVCGCIPPAEYSHPNLRVIPFLDKNKKESYAQFVGLLKAADFLFLPTRADCTPVVFCEAAAYAIPTITTDTGGVSGMIEAGVNGFMLPAEAGGAEYANLLYTLYSDSQAYIRLSISTRDKYEAELNWSAWSRRVKELFLATTHQQVPSAPIPAR